MEKLLDKFSELFPNIEFNIKHSEQEQLSIELLQSSEDELGRMIRSAKKDYNKARRLHKLGKMSSEELFDFEWRLVELQNELNSISDQGMDLDNELK